MKRLFTAFALACGVGAAVSAPQTAKIPRLADGHPDLQGTYDLATLTPVERAAGSPLVLSDEDAARLEKQTAQRKGVQDRALTSRVEAGDSLDIPGLECTTKDDPPNWSEECIEHWHVGCLKDCQVKT